MSYNAKRDIMQKKNKGKICMGNNTETKAKKKRLYTKFDRAVIALSFAAGALAVCECIALLDGAFRKIWEEMGINGYAGRVLVCIIMIISFVYLAQSAFSGRPFKDSFCAGMTFNGIVSILASVIFCYIPGYQKEWFAWKLGRSVTIDGYYFLLGIILILAGYAVKYALEEDR